MERHSLGREKILVRASKTEHHAGKGLRDMPLFSELRLLLLEAQRLAPSDSTYVISRFRMGSGNLWTQFKRLLDRADVESWPRLFQNLRSSRQTELTESIPAHVVCDWLGNTERIARDHYLQTMDEHWTSISRRSQDLRSKWALQKAVQYLQVLARNAKHDIPTRMTQVPITPH
jgi:hypothetical protein